MKLVEFLAAGVKGAENGSATFVLRGTASSAASVMYSDFEATAQPGTNIITLDANGAAEVYVNAYVDITLKTSGGSTLRTVTVGNTATTTEVISDSFTGTGYTGSPTAVSQPITLAAILDKWNNSAGSVGIDWKVAVNGVATNLSSAFSALAGLFFNVKDPAYGAAGDGVTDDTTAIGLAITAAAAAGGGIVFFPASTSFYKFTSFSISAANITLMGAGPQSSVLKTATTSADAISFTDSTAGSWKKIINLGIQGTGANGNEFLTIASCPNLMIENCDLNFSTYTGVGIQTTSSSSTRNIIIRQSVITLGVSVTQGIFNNSSADNTTIVKLKDNRFVMPASYTGTLLKGPNFVADSNTFDASAVTSGGYTICVSQSNATAGKFIGRFTNNIFIDGGSSGTVFDLSSIVSGSDFFEDSNQFVGFSIPSAATSADAIYLVSHNAEDSYRVYLGSRLGRTLEITLAATGTSKILAFSSYQNIFINYTAAGNATIQAPIDVMVSGAECNLVLFNNSGAQRDIVIDYGETPQTYGPQAATSGSDLTLQPNDQERVVVFMKMMHFGSGKPLAFVPVPVED